VAQLSLESALKAQATQLGFELCGIATAVRPEGFDWLRRWLDRGFAGEMDYIPRREAAYEHPSGVLPPVRSVVMLAMNYHTTERRNFLPLPLGEGRGEGSELRKHFDCEPIALSSRLDGITEDEDQPPDGSLTLALSQRERGPIGRVASYACGLHDYHDVLRDRLKQLADFLHEQRPGCRTRGCVDSAPLLERDFARLAGLGWFGKNTMLLNKRIGSFFFLAALLTDIELQPDEPHNTSHCGTCTRCLDACPTDAFVEPYVLDARKCISYLTIELRDQPIPTELRSQMGDWVFGCDVCQDVCPWNRKAPASHEPAFAPREQLKPLDLEWLLSLDEAGFEATFAGTPQHRTGRSALLRNAAIALGNSRDPQALPVLERASRDPDSLVREAAEWAMKSVGRGR
jgi:epoxyqueuosine reductase